MIERKFFDTNILVYAHASDDKRKRKIAQDLVGTHLRSKSAVISTQVLQEFFNATTRIGVSAETSRRHVADWARTNVVQVTPELILAAIDLHRLNQISLWDALILRAARAGGCTIVLSEDLNDGQIYDGVRVENPFAA